jgi:Putative prokaryotic signal transducing protein
MTGDLVNIHTFDYRHEADLAKSALEASGIHAIVASDDGGRQEMSLQFVRGAQLLVNPEDATRAKSVLRLG